MKRLMDQNFYELLGVEFNASAFEINRAYKENYQLYHEDSLVSYSLLSGEERRQILARLDEAYSTLIDEEKRSRYDQSLVECGILKEGMESQDEPRAVRLMSDSEHSPINTILTIRDEMKAAVSSNPVIQEILTHDVLWGKDLKRIRDELGVSLETIAEMTKVRIIFLRAIEDDEFEKAPSRMFLKSFLKAYAQSLGLDADFVASRYLKRINN
ncbi:MAG TPA: helix-turn-helix domain-containing protein [Thermodesulfobacteriota bacterium]|jgi:curved DNA-binding protein CbpA|nr:helix-turn-helix domain-containing protein [Thermodesulfobacteriota bacterium]